MKTARLDARIPDTLKRAIAKAASLQGRTITDFVVESLEKTATDTIREHGIMSLSLKDSEAFAAALISGRKPSSALKKALARHKKTVGVG